MLKCDAFIFFFYVCFVLLPLSSKRLQFPPVFPSRPCARPCSVMSSETPMHRVEQSFHFLPQRTLSPTFRNKVSHRHSRLVPYSLASILRVFSTFISSFDHQTRGSSVVVVVLVLVVENVLNNGKCHPFLSSPYALDIRPSIPGVPHSVSSQSSLHRSAINLDEH